MQTSLSRRNATRVAEIDKHVWWYQKLSLVSTRAAKHTPTQCFLICSTLSDNSTRARLEPKQWTWAKAIMETMGAEPFRDQEDLRKNQFLNIAWCSKFYEWKTFFCQRRGSKPNVWGALFCASVVFHVKLWLTLRLKWVDKVDKRIMKRAKQSTVQSISCIELIREAVQTIWMKQV
jgi:hypothetical protein